MKLIGVCDQNRLEKIQNLYEEAFPLAERRSFHLILQTRDKGQAEILAIEDENGDFLGLVITAKHKDLVLLDYFAISPNHRGSGIGSKVFQDLIQKYADKRFFLEIERTDVGADNQLERLKRKDFYIRNGMQNMSFLVRAFGVEMEILTYNCKLNYEDYFDLYYDLFGEKFSQNISLINECV